jgi:hypothetical protein
MEDLSRITDENAQQIENNHMSYQARTPQKLNTWYLVGTGILLLSFIVFGFGGYYLGKQSSIQQNNIPEQSTLAVASNLLLRLLARISLWNSTLASFGLVRFQHN